MNAIVKLSAAGAVVLPEELRDRLHLEPGAEFEVTGSGDRVVLQRRVAAAPRETITHEEFLARLPKYDGPPVTLEDMERAIEAGRAERVAKIMAS